MRQIALAIVALSVLLMGFEWEGRLSRLRRELDDADAGHRREVVRLLGSYSAREVEAALLRALEDPDAGVRAEAAEAAGRVRLAAAVPRLLDWLDDTDPDVRASAARALGAVRDDRAVAPLVRALGDANTDVRRAAVNALATLGTSEVIVPLLGRLDDGDASVRIDAVRGLGRIGDAQAAVPLIGRARDEMPEVRTAVFDALGELGDPRALPALVQGMRDESEEAQLAAVRAAGRLGEDGAVDPLAALLAEPNARRSRAVVSALGAIGGERGTAAVVAALDQHPTRPVAMDVLVAAAGTEEQGAAVEGVLVRELEAGGTDPHITAVASVLAAIADVRDTAAAAPALLAALRSGRGSSDVVLRALAATGSPDALVPILEQLQTDDEAVISAALGALEVFFRHHPPDGRAADPLLAVLGRVPDGERSRVVRLLGTVRAARALDALEPLLDHPDADLRRTAARAIGAIGDPAGASALLELLSHRDARTRFEAARALGDAAGPGHVARLLARLDGAEPTDRHAVLLALAGALPRLVAERRLGRANYGRAVDAWVRLLRSEDEALVARVVDSAARFRAPELVSPLARLLEGPNPLRQRAAALALGAYDDPRAVAALRAAVQRGVPSSVVAAAAAALGEHGVGADADQLFQVAAEQPWPANAAASFALARLARRGVWSAERARGPLCDLALKRGPFLRANAVTAMAVLGIASCPDGPTAEGWLGNAQAPVVRAAAARWLAVSARSDGADGSAGRQALERCRLEEVSSWVASACTDPSFAPLEDEVDIYAYGPDGQRVLVDTLVALRLGDGTVIVARTDANGHLRWRNVPAGPLVLDDPVNTPLEP